MKVDIINENSNSLNFCDGDIFRQLRFSQQQNNKIEECYTVPPPGRV